MVQLHDYSERGLVNALFESIGTNDNAHKLWAELIQQSVLWNSHLHGSTAMAPNLADTIEHLAIYVEPSLSSFGNPDVVVLVDYKTVAGQSRRGDVFFIEAKLETFESSSQTPDRDKNCSSVLHELFLKARFYQLARWPKATPSLRKHPLLTPGVRVYNQDKDPRKIGTDRQVLELAQAIATREAWFVSLTTDLTPQKGKPWPKELCSVTGMLKDIHDTNQHAHQQEHPTFTYADPLSVDWWVNKNLLLGWDKVWRWANKNSLERVKNAMRENRSKFKCRSIKPPPELLTFFDKVCGYDIPSKASRTRWPAKSRIDGALDTFEVTRGFENEKDKYWVVMHFSKQGRGLLTQNDVTKGGTVDRNTLYDRATKAGWAQ
ncbi:MAG TPA: hypothetical protein EYN06_05240 [Myxococcales bacterium]|nr:hypothetical protein [Myxococcales bacterium]